MSGKGWMGKTLYSLLFLLLVPLLQGYWAGRLDDLLPASALRWPPAFYVLGLPGLLLIGWGMISLWVKGGGLPMNAYPPPRLVQSGPYRLVSHPIYVGYALLTAGYFYSAGSAGGQWVVLPVTVLSLAALVLGYELADLEKRLGKRQQRAWLQGPRSDPGKPTRAEQSAVALLVLLWFLALSVVYLSMSIPRPAFSSAGHTVQLKIFLCYAGLFLVPLLAFFLQPSSLLLRKSWRAALAAESLYFFLALLLPDISYDGASLFSMQELPPLLRLLPGMGAALLLLTLVQLRAWYSGYPGRTVLAYTATALLLLLPPFISRQAPLYLLPALPVFLFSAAMEAIWSFLRTGAEKLANSWKEWVLGPVRIINHGIYVGLGAFGGILLCGYFAGRSYAWALLLFAVVVIVFAALWAQLIEGSEKLKRPFGYYGGIVGILAGSVLLQVLGFRVWVLLAVVSVVMPWVQAAGRLRCLVNGCCHGKPTHNEHLGIRYYHPRSRVCHLSGMKGQYLHPTQVYAILWLLLVGFVLVALWWRAYPYPFIFGIYLILTSLGRFVEESYRGEVQTAIWRGLRLYQWAALVTLLSGIALSMLRVPLQQLSEPAGWQSWVAAILGGLFCFFAMGVDFPRSNARFSRLV